MLVEQADKVHRFGFKYLTLEVRVHIFFLLHSLIALSASRVLF